MKVNPYQDLPEQARWSRAVSRVAADQVDPAVGFPFRISSADLVATAGSCFAQHIARHITAAGFSYFIAEPAHPIATPQTATSFNYGVFSARYGNIYTARQLVQLFDRAFGSFVPLDDVWLEEGRCFDPFRPAVEPGGFQSKREYLADRERHFEAVRLMFSQLNYFVFTLGLTECWTDRADGAVYPVCPGTVAGLFDPGRHMFHNQTVDEVVADLDAFLQRLSRVNPCARVILTVSPVPLAATALDRHVLVSTTYSKAVLRVAAETIVNRHTNVAYFPSFEIITGAFSRGGYYQANLRDVTEAGVEHVMRLFLQHATSMTPPPAAGPAAETDGDGEAHVNAANVAAVICEEAALDRGG